MRPVRHDEPIYALIEQTEIPGLFDATLSDGRALKDLTVGQVEHLIATENWQPARR